MRESVKLHEIVRPETKYEEAVKEISAEVE